MMPIRLAFWILFFGWLINNTVVLSWWGSNTCWFSCHLIIVGSITFANIKVHPPSFIIRSAIHWVVTHLTFVSKFVVSYRFTLLQILWLTKWCFIQISIIHYHISLEVVDKRRQGFGKYYTHPSSKTIYVHLFTQSVIWKVTIVT